MPMGLWAKFKRLRYYNAARLVHRWQGYPIVAMLEPTNRCNIRCALCPTSQDKTTRALGVMSWDDYRTIIDRIQPYIPTLYLMFAGEPFVCRDFERMVGYARQNHIETITSTNATLLNQDRARRLVHAGLDRLIVSIDGLTKETYERYRRGARFERVVENVRGLIAYRNRLGVRRPYVLMQFIAMRHNQHEIPRLRAFKRETGVDRVHVKAVSVPTWQGDGEDVYRQWVPEAPDLTRYQVGARTIQVAKPQSVCEWVRKTVVYWDGTVAMCCYDVDGRHTFGNLTRQTLPEIWDSRAYRAAREGIRRRAMPLCRTCAITDEPVLLSL